MAPKNDSTKPTPNKHTHPTTHQFRDKPTDEESSSSIKEYPMSELVEQTTILTRRTKATHLALSPPHARPQIKNPSQIPPHSPPYSQKREDSESKPEGKEGNMKLHPSVGIEIKVQRMVRRIKKESRAKEH